MKPRAAAVVLVAVVLLLALAILLTPVEAQQAGKVHRIGFLSLETATGSTLLDSFREALRDAGWIDGENIIIEPRFAEGRTERVAGLAADLVQQRVGVIVAVGGPPGRAAMQATRTIPVVVSAISDPVRAGFAESYARAGGNLAIVANLAYDLTPKRVELLKELAPRLSRVAVLGVFDDPQYITLWDRTLEAGQALGIRLHRAEVRAAGDYDVAFATAMRERVEAMVVQPDVVNFTERVRLCRQALHSRLLTIAPSLRFTQVGCLLSYGVDIRDQWRKVAAYVDKLLKGAKPADLPVEQPTKFELIINLKTAKALGLTIPPSLLLRADQVIE